MGFSLFWLLLLLSTGFSSYSSRALERRLNSCGTWAYLLCGVWDLPRSGVEPIFPALAGGFFTTEPPGKPHLFIRKFWLCLIFTAVHRFFVVECELL